MSIKEICEKYGIQNYTINNDGSIDIDGNVDLYYRNLTELPLRFNYVSGYFSCNNNKLTSLLGSPKSVGGNFYCDNNELTSLKGGPQSVGGHFDCGYNQISSLEGGPQSVGDFYCFNNPIHEKLGDIDYKLYIKQLNRDIKLNIILNE